MNTLHFIGPFAFLGSSPAIDDIPPAINGVYLWCARSRSGLYRVHYVGEAADIAKRLKEHRKNQLNGKYTGFCPEALQENIKVLKHRASQGMVTKYSSLDRAAFNRDLLEAISVFYADLGSAADKPLRCRYEYAMYVAVEDHGQNILAVGHLRGPTGEQLQVAIDSGTSNIEALSNEVLRV